MRRAAVHGDRDRAGLQVVLLGRDRAEARRVGRRELAVVSDLRPAADLLQHARRLDERAARQRQLARAHVHVRHQVRVVIAVGHGPPQGDVGV